MMGFLEKRCDSLHRRKLLRDLRAAGESVLCTLCLDSWTKMKKVVEYFNSIRIYV